MKTKTILLTLTTLFAAAETATPKRRRTIKKCWWPTFPTAATRAPWPNGSRGHGCRSLRNRPAEALPRGVPRRRRSGQARDRRGLPSGAENRPARRRAIRRDLHRFALLVVDRRTARRDLPRSARLHGQDPHPLHDARREPHGPQRSRHPTALPRRDRAQRRPRPRQRRSAGRPRNPTARRGGRTLSADGTPTVGTARANASRSPPRRAADVGEPTEIRRRPFLRTNTKTHKTTVGNTVNASVVIRIFLSLPLNGKQRTTKTESNATQTQNRSGRRLLRARHAALSRLHRHAPRMVRLAGAHPVPAGPAGR